MSVHLCAHERKYVPSRADIHQLGFVLNIFKLCSGNKQTFMRRMTEIANVARDLAASKMACSKKYTIFALTFKHDNVPKG